MAVEVRESKVCRGETEKLYLEICKEIPGKKYILDFCQCGKGGTLSFANINHVGFFMWVMACWIDTIWIDLHSM